MSPHQNLPNAQELRDVFGRPWRDLRISVTDRCNFRCPYCMPAEFYSENHSFMPREELLRFEEITRIARLAVELGVCKLRITGGEPLLRKHLEELIRQLAEIPQVEDLALTTNGWLLARSAKALRAAGLNRVTVSLDSLNPRIFAQMNGRGYGPQRILEGIRAAQEAGLHPIKVNAVIQRSVNEEAVLELARHFRGSGVIVRFIEYMDVGTCNGWQPSDVLSAQQMRVRIHKEWPLEAEPPQSPGEVASRWRYVDGKGELGFIASVSQPFCGNCSRARLSADGRLITCLFAASGPSLRDPMRAGASDASLLKILRGLWSQRTDRYSEEREAQTGSSSAQRIEMYQIGG